MYTHQVELFIHTIVNSFTIFALTGASLRFGAGGQSLCKALKILKIYSSRDGKSMQGKAIFTTDQVARCPALDETPVLTLS